MEAPEHLSAGGYDGSALEGASRHPSGKTGQTPTREALELPAPGRSFICVYEPPCTPSEHQEGHKGSFSLHDSHQSIVPVRSGNAEKVEQQPYCRTRGMNSPGVSAYAPPSSSQNVSVSNFDIKIAVGDDSANGSVVACASLQHLRDRDSYELLGISNSKSTRPRHGRDTTLFLPLTGSATDRNALLTSAT